MTYRTILEPKTAAVPFYAVFDFATYLAIGETISSAITTATCYSGSDTSPSSIISGSASISGSQVTQTIVNGVVGTTYLLTCTMVSSTSKTYALVGFLVVSA
jgi:hypothetical protein